MKIVLALFLCTLVSAANAFNPLAPVSMAFVIDTTGSMGNDIRQVRNGVRGILAVNSRLTQKIFLNFVVAPYNDPGVPRPLVTVSSGAVQNFVNRLRPRGGGDCPELAMAGLLNAIRYSSEGSIVFFFSDANAKDVRLWRNVLNGAKRKHITLVFVMTGCCRWGGGCSKFSYHVYKKLARATNGAHYRIPKNGVHFILDFIKAAIKNGLPALRKLPPNVPALKKAIKDLKRAPCVKRPCVGKGAVCRNVGKTRRTCTCINPRARYIAGRGCRVPPPPATPAPPTAPPVTCMDWNGGVHKPGETYTLDCVTYRCQADGTEKEVKRMCSGGSTCKPVGSVWPCKEDGVSLTCKCLMDGDGLYTLME